MHFQPAQSADSFADLCIYKPEKELQKEIL
jgi:hypothetical protein